MDSFGIVYVASRRERYVEEAFLSALSAKKFFPNLPITLFTDMIQNPLCLKGLFDTVRPINGPTSLRWATLEGKLNRVRCLVQTPYKRTLHLDTDTRVMTDKLPSLFALLDKLDVAMVETTPSDSYSRRQYGKRMFKAGVILYRWNNRTSAWLKHWAAISERNFRLAERTPLGFVATLNHIGDDNVRRRLLCMDQVSLVEILNPETNRFRLEVKKLDDCWNYRRPVVQAEARDTVKILHAPRNRVQNHTTNLEEGIRFTVSEAFRLIKLSS
jgi:hypothetical protein